jgi:hypothetical protein
MGRKSSSIISSFHETLDASMRDDTNMGGSFVLHTRGRSEKSLGSQLWFQILVL